MFSSDEEVKISDRVVNFLFLQNNLDARDRQPLTGEASLASGIYLYSTPIELFVKILYVFPNINIMLL